jgi:hypothetical protein
MLSTKVKVIYTNQYFLGGIDLQLIHAPGETEDQIIGKCRKQPKFFFPETLS